MRSPADNLWGYLAAAIQTLMAMPSLFPGSDTMLHTGFSCRVPPGREMAGGYNGPAGERASGNGSPEPPGPRSGEGGEEVKGISTTGRNI